jgi:hypothetical protein
VRTSCRPHFPAFRRELAPRTANPITTPRRCPRLFASLRFSSSKSIALPLRIRDTDFAPRRALYGAGAESCLGRETSHSRVVGGRLSLSGGCSTFLASDGHGQGLDYVQNTGLGIGEDRNSEPVFDGAEDCPRPRGVDLVPVGLLVVSAMVGII